MTQSLLISDPDYESALGEMGFCVAPIFTLAQIGQIKELYGQYAIDSKVTGLIASHSKMGPEKNRQVSHSLRQIVMPALERWFTGFDFFIGGFMVKEGHTARELPLHQDWNIVDESLYTSYQIWIPTELSYPANGGMYVLPGSHRFFSNYRSGTYGIPTVEVDQALRPLITDMIIPPGSALVFHNSLFHASYPNDTDQNRISAIISIYPKNAPLQYCQKNTLAQCTDVYTITPDIFLSSLPALENGGVPEHPLEKITKPLDSVDNRDITAIELLQKSTAHRQNAKYFEPQQMHILKDSALERQMQRDGYVVLDFADATLVEDIKALYFDHFAERQTATGRFTTMEHCSPEIRRHFHSLLLDKINAPLHKYFKDFQVPIASYFVKYAHSQGDLSWHNDSSLLLNAHLEPHYAIWCPLLDVSADNGALCVIRKTDKFSTGIVLQDLPWPYTHLADTFEQKKEILELTAGQAVLFDIRLIHHATPNHSAQDRVCFSLRITHQKSRYYNFLCETTAKDSISVFAETADCYLRDDWNTGAKPLPSLKIGKMQIVHPPVRAEREEAPIAEKPEKKIRTSNKFLRYFLRN